MRAPLRADDGAKFYGRVVSVDGGFRASCYASLQQGDSDYVEAPEHEIFRSEAEGLDWIRRKAASRGFAEWYNEG